MASFIAFLKAFPVFVDSIKSLNASVLKLADSRTDAKIAEIRKELRVANEKFQETNDRDEMLKIIHDLNTSLSE